MPALNTGNYKGPRNQTKLFFGMNGVGPCPSWEEIPLGNILTYLDERCELEDATEYITITVKRRHGGLEPREKLFGFQIKT